jgi:hypothetical protein
MTSFVYVSAMDSSWLSPYGTLSSDRQLHEKPYRGEPNTVIYRRQIDMEALLRYNPTGTRFLLRTSRDHKGELMPKLHFLIHQTYIRNILSIIRHIRTHISPSICCRSHQPLSTSLSAYLSSTKSIPSYHPTMEFISLVVSFILKDDGETVPVPIDQDSTGSGGQSCVIA